MPAWIQFKSEISDGPRLESALPIQGHSAIFARSKLRERYCMKLSLVVPCYNEEAVLPQLFQRLTAAAEKWGCDWEVVCFNATTPTLAMQP
jgi:hypothetical protein